MKHKLKTRNKAVLYAAKRGGTLLASRPKPWRYAYMKINIVIISTFMILVAGCEKEEQELIISIHGEEVFINSEKVVDLEGELKSLSCSEDTKIKLQATQGLPYDQLETTMSQISKAGCMNQLELERL